MHLLHSFLCIKYVQSDKILKSESVETVIPVQVTMQVPLLSYLLREDEDTVRTHTIIPDKKKCERQPEMTVRYVYA